MLTLTRVIWLCALGLISRLAGAADLEFGLSAEKASYYPGEPVLLLVQINNNLPHPIRVDLGHSNLGAFTFKLHPVDSEPDAAGTPRQINRPGPSVAPWIRVGAMDSTNHPIILNQWCSTRLPSGRYRLDCRISGYLLSDPTKTNDQGLIDLEFPPDVLQSLELEIKAANPAEQAALIQSLSKSVSASVDDQTSLSLAINRRKLLFAETEDTLDFKIDTMLNEKHYWEKHEALAAIEMLQSPSAKVLLEAIMSDPGKAKRVESIRELIQNYLENGKMDRSEFVLIN
jgi:hypothetical protein